MLSKKTQLDQLFVKWIEAVGDYQNKFVYDGIICEDLYANASQKILFITKEPNDPNQEGGDYREWWQQGLKYGFSNRIAEWSCGLLNDNFPEFEMIDKSAKLDAIKRIALMNIKKIGGRATSVYQEMESHLKTNLSFIHEQIRIIEPDIIILCVSWSKTLRDMIFPNTVWTDSGYEMIPIARYGNMKIIDFYHPSARKASAFTYNLLKSIVLSDKFKGLK